MMADQPHRFVGRQVSLQAAIPWSEKKLLRNTQGPSLRGVDDWRAARMRSDHGPDIAAVVAGRDPNRELVLLAHQPAQIEAASQHGVGLQISGHTHGGQIWPFGYLVHLTQPYLAGLHRHGSAQIYVSRGAGHWGPPMRLGAPAELTQIELLAGTIDRA